MPSINPASGDAPGLPAVLPRRSFLAALAPLGALVVASPAIARTNTREELIEHHKAELFRLLNETVPEGTVLDHYMVHYSPRSQFLQMTSTRPEWTGRNDPRWHFSTLDNAWEYVEGLP